MTKKRTQQKTGKPRGRPSKFSKTLADRICEELTKGRTLRDVCRDDDMPSEAVVRAWALDDIQGFSAQYTRAREIGYQTMADEVLDIADDGTNDYITIQTKRGTKVVLDQEHVARSRLRFDARRWMLSKALPKLYGDKIALTDPDGGTLKVEVVKYADSSNT